MTLSYSTVYVPCPYPYSSNLSTELSLYSSPYRVVGALFYVKIYQEKIFVHLLLFVIGSENFALGRPATQNSTFTYGAHSWVAGRAVDGDTVNTASWTDNGDLQPWWKVHLAYPVMVTHVEITNIKFDNSELFESPWYNQSFSYFNSLSWKWNNTDQWQRIIYWSRSISSQPK